MIRDTMSTMYWLHNVTRSQRRPTSAARELVAILHTMALIRLTNATNDVMSDDVESVDGDHNEDSVNTDDDSVHESAPES